MSILGNLFYFILTNRACDDILEPQLRLRCTTKKISDFIPHLEDLGRGITYRGMLMSQEEI